MKRYDKALADYDKVISIDPRLAMAYTNRGFLHAEMFRPNRMGRATRQCTAVAPASPAAMRHMW